MFFIKNGCPRKLNRKAYGIKSLFVDETVNNGDAVTTEVDTESSSFIIKKEDKPHTDSSREYIEDYEEIEEEEINVLTDRFSPVANFNKDFGRKTLLEVTFVGDYMLISLVSGVIFIDNPLPNAQELLAFRNVPEIAYEGKGVPQGMKWINTKQLRDTLQRLFQIDEQFVNDYVYEIYVDMQSGVVSYSKKECYDISLGAVSSKVQVEFKNESARDDYKCNSDEDDGFEDLGTGSMYDYNKDDDEYYEDDEYDGFHIVGGEDE